MTRSAASALALAVALLAAGARAQVPDVPTGDATLRGHVVHAGTRTPVAGAEVVLYALPASAPPGMRRVKPADDGSFVIDGIDGSPSTTYLVGARYLGVSHPGARVVFEAGERERNVDIEVSEVSSRAGKAAASALHMRIDWLGDQLVVTETLSFENPGHDTILLPESGPPLIELGLPAGAGELTGALGVLPQGLERRGQNVAWYGPLFPGRHEVEYAYPLPVGAGPVDLGRQLPGGLQLVVLVSEGGPALTAPALSPGDAVATRGRGYASFAGQPPAGRVDLALTLPEARHDPGAVSVAEVRWIGDLDGAALTVREEHVLRTDGDTPVVAGDAPLDRIPLPAEAREVRFAARDSGSALAPVDGALGVLGPLAPGETTIELSYRLPADDPLHIARRFGSRIPLFSLYLTDNGNLDVNSERLHRRRPLRTQDRSYLHFEAFELGPDETADLSVHALPPRQRLPRRAALATVALGGAAAIALLIAPLGGGRRTDAAEERESANRREREALYAALEDLEHDFETGKLSREDHDRLRRELRTRALASLAADRGPAAPAEAAAAAPVAAPPPCTCGHRTAPGDRFCSQCGAALPGTAA